jgi:ribosomal protein S5
MFIVTITKAIEGGKEEEMRRENVVFEKLLVTACVREPRTTGMRSLLIGGDGKGRLGLGKVRQAPTAIPLCLFIGDYEMYY